VAISQVILIISCITSFAMTAVIWVIAKTYPKNIHGLKEWAWGSLLVALSLCLFLVRDHIPLLIGILIPNLIILLAFMLMNAGTRRFAGYAQRNIRPLLSVFVALYIGLFYWHTIVEPDIAIRMTLLSFFTLIVTVDQFVFTCLKLPQSIGRNLLLLSLLGLIATRVFRIITLVTGIDHPNDIFDASISQLVLVATPAIMIPLATVSYLMLASERLNQELGHAVRHDDLTGCLNKNAGTQVLENEIARSKRYRSPLSILFMDIDDFKKINDTYGHLFGDQVLTTFASETRKCMRSNDSLVRFGGDEFIAILPNTTLEGAIKLSEHMHRQGKLHKTVQWSVSIGAAEWGGAEDSLDQLLARADHAAYQSKKTGRQPPVPSAKQ
jgi:diguanylate cyclase (GGDEF)-like protein